MRRTSTIALLWLAATIIAGVVVSVAVAWGCAMWSSESARQPLQRADPDDPLVQLLLAADEHYRYPLDRFSLIAAEGFGWRRSQLVASRSKLPGGGPENLRVARRYEAGWPALCLQGDELRLTDAYTTTTRWLWKAKSTQPRQRVAKLGSLPYKPIWWGLLVNTAMFGSPVALLGGWFVGRRVLRSRRNQCVRCGYSRRGAISVDRRCPECGAALIQKRKRTAGGDQQCA